MDLEPVSEPDQRSAWEAVQHVLKGQLSAPSFETWIAPLKVLHIQPDAVTLETASGFNRDWILKNYRDALSRAFASILDMATLPAIKIQVVEAPLPLNIDTSADVSVSPARNGLKPWSAKVAASSLNPRYTFEQFVVGNHNRFAYAAALAVAETPSQSYNPLFLYGGVGLGKTHLMQAIGHFCHAHHPDLKVRYVTTEQFTNDLIHALGSKEMKAFRDKYRRVDVLLIDDVQFLEGKDRTQEEIFHTFNTLHQAGKQIILSSDRPPNRLSRLEDRLRSRFAWGLIADIQSPDFETRMAILQRKATQLALYFPNDVAQYVAESFPTNIRELEGALNKLSAYKMLTGSDIDLTQAQTLLGRRFDPTRLSLEDVAEHVARYYHLRLSDLQGALRTKHVAHARQVAIYVVRELTETSFPQLGNLFGNRRHTTALYAYEKMKELLKQDATLKQQVSEIMDTIKSSVMH